MNMQEIQQRQQFAEEYASFAQSRNGLGKVIGGLVGIVVILTGTLLGGGLTTAVVTIGATGVWLVAKEVLRARLYQPYGVAAEQWRAENRRTHNWAVAVVALVAAAIIAFVIWRGDLDSPTDWVYLFFVAAMPLITWRFLRTPLEFIVGVFLLAACAVHGAGGAYSLVPIAALSLAEIGMLLATWSPFLGAFYLVWLGIREHRDFQRLTRRMEMQA